MINTSIIKSSKRQRNFLQMLILLDQKTSRTPATQERDKYSRPERLLLQISFFKAKIGWESLKSHFFCSICFLFILVSPFRVTNRVSMECKLMQCFLLRRPFFFAPLALLRFSSQPYYSLLIFQAKRFITPIEKTFFPSENKPILCSK